MNIQTTRICKECKELVILEEYNFIHYKKSYYHFDCFVGMLVNKKRKPLGVDEAKRLAIELRDDKENREIAEKLINKNRLSVWLKKSYDLTYIPAYFFQKLEDIYNGNYKDIEEIISPEDILFIWRKKKREFDQLNDYQRKKGKYIEGSDRLNYDLAIVLSKYNSYKKWKEQQRIIQEENKELMINSKYNYSDIDKKVMINVERENDISEYLEEI